LKHENTINTINGVSNFQNVKHPCTSVIDDVLATVLNETPSTNFASQKVSETNRPTFPHGNMFILSDKR